MAQGRATPTQMAAETDVSFGPFRLERNTRLWRGEHLVALRPGALALLRYLAERPGQLVTKEELLQQVWLGIYVTPTALRVGVHAIRRALQDDPGTPRFLETVGRQGYRFLGVVGTSAPVPPHPLPHHFVGRTQELAALHTAWARAQQDERQVVFLLGEPGIGKTTLVDRFLGEVQTRGPVRIGRGQCLELHGPGEAYLPLLEALGQLCQDERGERVLTLLRRYAPLWLVQMAGLLEAHERDALFHQVQGRGQECMVREFAEVVERLAADVGLVLVVEDLQWSDASTVAALAYLAQRRGPVRLHLIGTYRPAEVAVRAHPLRRVVQELAGHGQCEELALELLTEAEVEAYLGQRFGQRPVDPSVSQMIHHYTDGNALFMVHFVDYLCQQDVLVNAGGRVAFRGEHAALQGVVPHTLQQFITRHIEVLGPAERYLLEVASVAGQAFTAATVAGVVGQAIEAIEGVYDTLAMWEHFIARAGMVEGPDGTVTMQYAFRHALYQQVLYERVGAARCMRLHRQLGERTEAHYSGRAAEIAGALAVHVTQGQDDRRAARFHAAQTRPRPAAHLPTPV